MVGVIWSGAADASDVFLLVAAILAAVVVVLEVVRGLADPAPAVFAAALGFVALGLLAI